LRYKAWVSDGKVAVKRTKYVIIPYLILNKRFHGSMINNVDPPRLLSFPPPCLQTLLEAEFWLQDRSVHQLKGLDNKQYTWLNASAHPSLMVDGGEILSSA
jgi:hypothetical protein